MQANLLKAKMVEAGYTQRSLAEEMHISRTALNFRLSGKRKFTLDEVSKLCSILGIYDPQDKVRIFLS